MNALGKKKSGNVLAPERLPGVNAMMGEASPLPPTLAMRFGEAVGPYFDAVKGFFPESNPYGQSVQNFLMGNAPQAAEQMAEGYTNVLGNFRGDNPLNYTLNQNAVDMAGALPIGAAADTAMKIGALGKMGLGAKEAIIAFHGSPHKFDKFSLSKIGTGEGAQAYGHGLYFAESPDVAGMYAAQVKDNSAIDGINAELSRLAKIMSSDEIGYRNYRSDVGRDAAKQYDALMAQRSQVTSAPGNLYHVDIPDEHIDKMLDWDGILSEQPQAIQDIAKMYGIKGEGGADVYGRDVYRALEKRMGGARGAAEFLRNNGVPGNRYWDAGSRGQGGYDGGGTRNFVLFDDQMPKILKRR